MSADDRYTDSVEKLVSFGLDSVDPDQTVTVNLRDLLYVCNTLSEYMRFFHQPAHYPTVEKIEDFLGSIDEPKGFRVLHTALYKKAVPMIPAHIQAMYDDGAFDSGVFPWYYKGEE